MPLFRNPFHRLQPAPAPGGDDSATISRVEDLIRSAWDTFLADLERLLIGAGVVTPGVPPNPPTVNGLGRGVVWTDSTGRLRTDVPFFYVPATGATPAQIFAGLNGGDVRGVVAQFFAKVGGTIPGLIAAGENAGANPLTAGQPFFAIDNDGGNFSGLAFRFGVIHCGITAGIDGSIQICAPDFLAAGGAAGGLSVYADLAQTTRIARFDPHGAHGAVTIDSLAGLANGALTADAAGKLQKVPTLTIVDNPGSNLVNVTATGTRALALGAGGVDDWVLIDAAGVITASELAGSGTVPVNVSATGVLLRGTAIPAIPFWELSLDYGNGPAFDNSLPVAEGGVPPFWLLQHTWSSVANTGDVREWEVGAAFGHVTLDVFVYTLTTSGTSPTVSLIVTKNGTDTACLESLGSAATNTRFGPASVALSVVDGDRIGVRVNPSGLSGGALRCTVRVRLTP